MKKKQRTKKAVKIVPRLRGRAALAQAVTATRENKAKRDPIEVWYTAPEYVDNKRIKI